MIGNFLVTLPAATWKKKKIYTRDYDRDTFEVSRRRVVDSYQDSTVTPHVNSIWNISHSSFPHSPHLSHHNTPDTY